jgi:transcriptional regulator with XRE-family HTH domain
MLNKVLKLVRQYHRLDQKTAAKKLGISKSYLSEIETGKKEPTLRIIDLYTVAFDLPSSSLLLISESLKDGKKKRISEKAIQILDWAAN